MTDFLMIALLVAGFTLFHELGHLAVARYLGLQIDRLGFSWKPYPHPYVSVSNLAHQRDSLLFLGGGSLFTLMLTIGLWLTGALGAKWVYTAIGIQWLIETNPFYSDITLAINSLTSKEKLAAYLREYQAEYVDKYGLDQVINFHRSTIDGTISSYVNLYIYSLPWYVHFAVWIGLFAFLFGP